MNSRREIVVTTRLPPLICGVGTYSWFLHKYCLNEAKTTHFLVMEGATESRAALDCVAIDDFAGQARKLTDSFSEPRATRVLLHYSGRGYHRLGCPTWLPGALRNWKTTCPGGKLVVLFHEIPGELPIYSRHFWLGKIEARIIRQLATLADIVIANSETHVDTLRILSGRNDIAWVPVGSNIELTDS